jgi:hypothetical protein
MKDMGRYCPLCKSDWQGVEIPIEHRENYAEGTTHFSRLIGIEIQGGYDGVSYWKCPDCGATWNRFTGELHTIMITVPVYLPPFFI